MLPAATWLEKCLLLRVMSLPYRLALRIFWSCLQVCSSFHRVLRCCISSENPVGPLVYLNYILVTWKFLYFCRQMHSEGLLEMSRRKTSPPSTISKGEQRLVCPHLIPCPSATDSGNSPLSKSLMWSPW